MNFVIVNRDDNRLRATLQRIVPMFFESAEYLESGVNTSNGILVAAFAEYLGRVLQENRDDQVSMCFDALNWMAESKDPEVVNYVITEVFENLSLFVLSLEKFTGNLRGSALALYESWKSEQA